MEGREEGEGSLSEANSEHIKNQEGKGVKKGGLFETSLRRCLLKLGFSDVQAQDVIEKPPDAEGKGGTGKGMRKASKGGALRPPLHIRGAGGKGGGRWPARNRCLDARWSAL